MFGAVKLKSAVYFYYIPGFNRKIEIYNNYYLGECLIIKLIRFLFNDVFINSSTKYNCYVIILDIIYKTKMLACRFGTLVLLQLCENCKIITSVPHFGFEFASSFTLWRRKGWHQETSFSNIGVYLGNLFWYLFCILNSIVPSYLYR